MDLVGVDELAWIASETLMAGLCFIDIISQYELAAIINEAQLIHGSELHLSYCLGCNVFVIVIILAHFGSIM